MIKQFSIKELQDRFRKQSAMQLTDKLIFFYSDADSSYFLLDFFNDGMLTNQQTNVVLGIANHLKNKNINKSNIFIILPEYFSYYSSDFLSSLFLLRSISHLINSPDIYIYSLRKSNGIYSLVQNLYSGYLTSHNRILFHLITSDLITQIGVEWTPSVQNISQKLSFSKYTVSDHFSPLLFVDQINFNLLFGETIGNHLEKILKENTYLNDLDKLKHTQEHEDELYQSFYKCFLERISPEEKKSNETDQRYFYLMHYLKFISRIRILSFYISKKYGNNESDVKCLYFEKYKLFFKEKGLENETFFFILIFSLIGNEYFKMLFKSYKEEKKIKKIKWNPVEDSEINELVLSHLKKIYEYTINIYSGLYELSKNIVQHSEYHSGLIMIRILTKDNIIKIKNDYDIGWLNYFVEQKTGDKDYYLDISVIDNGRRGIFTTYCDNIQSMINLEGEEYANRLYREDLIELESLLGDNPKPESELLYNFFKRTHLEKKQKDIVAASYGTNIFYQRIVDMQGAFMAMTNKYNNSDQTTGFLFYNDRKGKSQRHFLENNVPYGTNYNILIPFERLSVEIDLSKTESPSDCFSKYIRHESEGSFIYTSFRNATMLKELKFPYNEDAKLSILKKHTVCCYDCSDLINQPLDYSNFSRKIGKIATMNELLYNNGIVLYGLTENEAAKLWDFLMKNRPKNNFWHPGSCIWIFYKKEHIYSSFLLTGNSIDECRHINYTFESKHFINIPEKHSKIVKKGNSLIIPGDNPLFSHQSLLPVELFLRDKYSDSTYFEINSADLLLRHVDEGGYNMQDVHLKIGSKIHLQNFIVGKRFFQNNNYSSGFAYLLSDYIFNEIVIKSTLPVKEYVLLGYGYYSELMVSKTEIFLREKCEDEKIKKVFSHFIVEDSESLRVDEYINFYADKIKNKSIRNIIIVPISSTLTTQLVIENSFREGLKNHPQTKAIKIDDTLFVTPYFTIALIGDGKLEEPTLLRNNYWIKGSKEKTVISKNIEYYLKERENKFFIYLPNKWYSPASCALCGLTYNKEDRLEIEYSRPLFVADKVSVTPSLIWRLPNQIKKADPTKIRVKDWRDISIGRSRLTDESVREIHKIGTNKHFNYYIHYDLFFKSNLKEIKRWIRELKIEFPSDRNYLLITPEKSSNGPFVNLINKELFDEKANILNFSPSEIALEDFLTFFKSGIYNVDKIIYVDNLLATGFNFFAINNLIISLRNVRTRQGNPPRFDRIISLIDRLGEKDRQAINRVISKNNLYSIIKKIERKCKDHIVECINLQNDELLRKILNRINERMPNDMFSEEGTDNRKEEFVSYWTEQFISYLTDLIENNEEKKLTSFMKIIYYDEFERKKIQEDIRKNNKNRLYAFSRFNIPVIGHTNKENSICYLCEEEARYKSIIGLSNLDCIKQYIYLKKYEKVKAHTHIGKELRRRRKGLIRFAISHKLVSLLSENEFKKYNSYSFSEFMTYLRDDYKIEFFRQIKNVDNEFKINVLKILSTPPFVNYKNIKDVVFNWTKSELINTTSELNDCLIKEDQFICENKIHYLKVLINLASNLHINYIISFEFLISASRIIRFIENCKDGILKNKVDSLKIFITSAIKEVLFVNPQLCIVLEREIQKLLDLKQEPDSLQFVDLLLLENTLLATKAAEIQNRSLSKLWESDEADINIDFLFSGYKENLDNQKLGVSKVKDLVDFLTISNDGINQEASYLYATILQKYLTLPNNKKQFQVKLERIIQLIANIIEVDLLNGGGCLLFQHQQENRKVNQAPIIISKLGEIDCTHDILDGWVDSCAKKILEGGEVYDKIGDESYPWTSITFNLSEEEMFISKYNQNPQLKEGVHIFKENKEIKRLYYLKLDNGNRFMNEEIRSKGKAIFIFYDNKDHYFSFSKIRYALSVRNALSAYIHSITSENATFWSWLEDKQKIVEFRMRYRKHTHGVYKLIDNFINDRTAIFKDPILMQIIADLVIGKCHYILVDSMDKVDSINKNVADVNFGDDYTRGKLRDLLSEDFQEGLKLIIAEKEKSVNNGKGKDKKFVCDCSKVNLEINCRITRYMQYLIVSLLMNALKYRNEQKDFLFEITHDKEYLYIRNTNADLKKGNKKVKSIEDIKEEILKNSTIPFQSITLYVINRYYLYHLNKEIDVEYDSINSNSFIVKLPLNIKEI